MGRTLTVAAIVAVAFAAAGIAAAARESKSSKTGDLSAYLPDIRTVVPTHLQLVNAQQREILRFSNGIANTGPGPWALRPDPPVADASTHTTAVQEIRSNNAYYKCGEQPKQVTYCYDVLKDIPTGTFEFHPAHNHWHIGDVALFEVERAARRARSSAGTP